MGYGTVLASFNVEEFGTERVSRLEPRGDRRAPRGAAADDAVRRASDRRRVAPRYRLGPRPGGRTAILPLLEQSFEGGRWPPSSRPKTRPPPTPAPASGVADRHRQPHRQDLRAADRGRDRARPWTCARSRSTEDEFGMMSYDPAFTNTASCRSSVTYIDGDAGILEHRGYSIEQLCERSTFLEVAYLLIFGELPTGAPARPLGLRHHPPHLRPRGPEAVLRGLPLRRPPDGDAALRRRRALDLLPGREADRRPRRALHGGGPADRQGADPRRLLLPAQHGLPLRLPGQRPQLRRELPLDDVQENRSQDTSPSRRSRGRSTCSSSSTPTTNRTARPTPSAASAPPTSTPTRRWRPGVAALYGPAARRRQRGGAEDAAADRVARRRPASRAAA